MHTTAQTGLKNISASKPISLINESLSIGTRKPFIQGT